MTMIGYKPDNFRAPRGIIIQHEDCEYEMSDDRMLGVELEEKGRQVMCPACYSIGKTASQILRADEDVTDVTCSRCGTKYNAIMGMEIAEHERSYFGLNSQESE